MACQRLDFAHRWVLPNNDLVETVAVSRDELVGCFREHEVAHLGSCVDAVDGLQSVRVPESDASICCAAASSEET